MVELGGRNVSLVTPENIAFEVRSSMFTGRNFADYCNYLRFSEEDIVSKRILDVGAGLSTFAKGASKYGAEVIRIDGRYVPGRSILDLDGEKDLKNNSVAGFAQFLPFANDVFDETISLSVFQWMDIGVDQAMLEMIRVTRSNGKIRIFPFNYEIPRELLDWDQILTNYEVDARQGKYQGLIIKKTKNLTEHHWGSLVEKMLSS